MKYSERKLRIEFQIVRFLTLAFSVLATIGANNFLGDIGVKNSGALSVAFIFIPGLWVLT
jgi:hypothetical protein